MKKKLNIKIEEVRIDKYLQAVGMFGGPCGSGGGNGVTGNLKAHGFTSKTSGGYCNPDGVACGGCHGTVDAKGRAINEAIGKTAVNTAANFALSGPLAGIEAGITTATIAAENISRGSYSKH